jgi:SpoVK/Ycf46/Vps4 family AAA+-type ATPase
MNQNRFEELIRQSIGRLDCKELYPESYEYTIVKAFHPQYNNMKFFIANCGISGIGISFYDLQFQKMRNIDRIYHWSDAYEILYLALTSPGRLIFESDSNTLSIEKTLNKPHYDFTWNPPKALLNFSDEILNDALSMTENQYITDIQYDSETEEVTISASIYPCEETILLSDLSKKSKENFLQYDVQTLNTERKYILPVSYELMTVCSNTVCPQTRFCIIGLCGYLEYAAKNGILYDLLSERKQKREAYRIPNGMYQFTWNPEDGLKMLAENKFNLAVQIVNNGQVKVESSLSDDNRVRIQINDNLCKPIADSEEWETTSCQMAAKSQLYQSESDCDQNLLYIGVTAPLSTSLYDDSCQCCGCNCIFFYAGYIQYLMNSGNEEIITQDREYFNSHRAEIENSFLTEFDYTLPSDLFLDTPETMFQIAEMLQEQNYVSLHQNIFVNDQGESSYVIDLVDDLLKDRYDDLDLLKQDLLEQKLDRTVISPYFLSSYDDLGLLKKVVALASYLDYLRKTGQYESYRKTVVNRQKALTEDLGNTISEIPELRKVLAIAENEKESGLYCVIQGERGVGKRQVVEKIAKLLAQKGKIDESEYEMHTFDDLASMLGYKDMYDFGSGASENQFFVYSGFEKRKLYVLTDLKEFIYASEQVSDGDGSKISHLIKLLGRYQPQTYIIIIGEQKYVDRFLKLSPKIKFLYENNIIPLQNLSAEKIYGIFEKKLSNSLYHQLTPEFENKFLTYIALNRKLLPLGNQELADYLAAYANNHKQLILPPDVFRKKTVAQMLESMVGMQSIKKKTAEFERYAIFLKRAEMEGMNLPNSNLHMIFTGNPGTGKTMIARLIGQILFELGIVQENRVTEVEAKDLKSPYIGDSAIKTGKIIDRAMGGVLFIDEAYSIGNDAHGKEAVATLIKAMEDHKDKLVVIFAGYEDEMREFLNINSGIASRIGYTFHFDDYTVEELTAIFDVKMKAAGFTYGEEVLQAVQAVCEHFAGKKNFGNGRFVDKLIQQIILNHSGSELTNQTVRIISRDEIPSIEEMVSTDAVEHKNYEDQLSAFIGMENVKEQVRSFAKFVTFQQMAKSAGADIPSGNMHMIFTGNPGTGKTAIARVMVDLLYDIGMIKENKLVEVERKDLVAEYVGQTAVKTAEVIDKALDGVLFIDEAYTLLPNGTGNDFGAEAIATLMKAMEDHKNDLIVIFAGYQEEMRQFVNANPGIASRIGTILDFPDYSPEELVEMYRRKMEQAGFTVSEQALKKVGIVTEYFSKKKNFGNGRFVGKLQQKTFMLHSKQIRSDHTNLKVIDAEDIPEISDLNHTAKKIQTAADLDQIIGLSEVKETLKELEQTVNFGLIAKEHGLKIPDSNMHMLFLGNPGTGKTTIARMIVQKLYDIGVIQENKLVEAERKDLIAGYVGQTAIKTGEVIEKAMGGVLFIDEAYTLTPNESGSDFSGEAIATLIKAMEDHKDDLIVIFAGYEKEMRDFVGANPGIASRIGFTFHFEDYTPSELTEIYVSKMKANGFTVTSKAEEKIKELMEYFSHVENFGNGRFVDRMIQHTLALHAKQYKIETIEIIDAEDIPTPEEIKKTLMK